MSVTVISKLKIQNAANSPIIDAEDAAGAWSTVADITARDAIVSSARRLHMVVTLASTGISYELSTGLTNADWTVKSFAGGVTSVFTRLGAVVAALGDYSASLIANDSSVSGATVKDALNTLLAAIPSVPVSSVFGRVGAVVAAVNDYSSSQVSNSSGVTGATVTAALNTLLSTATQLVSNTQQGQVPATGGGVGKALLATATGTVWGTNFGAQDITTTGVVRLGTGTVATTLGDMRVSNNYGMYFRNFANTQDFLGVQFGNGTSANVCVFGSFNNGFNSSCIFTQGNGPGSFLIAAATVATWTSTGFTINAVTGVLNFFFAGQIQQNGIVVFGWPNSANRNLSIWGDGTQNYQTGERITAILDRVAEPAAGSAGMFFLYSQNGRPKWVTSSFDRVEWSMVSSASATAGGGAVIPATVSEFLTIIYNGNTRKIPLYAN